MYSAIVVDDEPEVARALARVLSRRGFTVETFTDPLVAVVAIAAKKPDVVLSDYRMPGMNGVELLTAVEARSPRTLRFLISAFALMDTEKSKNSLFIAKPWKDAALAAALLQELAERDRREAEQAAATPTAASSG